MNLLVPYQIPLLMRMYPPTGFARLLYLLCIACSNSYCFKDIKFITDEIFDCILFLYIGSVFFLILGIYFFEVLP